MDNRLSLIMNRYSGVVKKVGDKLLVECPVGGHEHDKIDPKTELFITGNDTVGVHCHKCSDSREVYKWFANEYPDCFPKRTATIEKRTKSHTLCSAPDGFEFPEFNFSGKPFVARYVYKDTEGKPTGLAIYRHLNSDGTKSILKTHTARKGDGSIVLTFGGSALSNAQFYGTERFKPDRPLIVVEGEKCVDWGYRMLGNTFNFVTWEGGASNYAKAEWSELAGYPHSEVILWPDNDRQGLAWAVYGKQKSEPVARRLESLGFKVRLVNPNAYEWPDKFDIADALQTDDVDVVGVLSDSGPCDAIILAEVYDNCVIARERALSPSVCESILCGSEEECKSCRFSVTDLVKHPSEIPSFGLSEFLVDCVFMEENNMFYDLRKRHGYSVDGFNNSWAHRVALMPDEKRGAKQIFLEHPRTLKVSGRTFAPKRGMVCTLNDAKYLNNWAPARLNAVSDARGLELWQSLIEHLIPNPEYRETLYDWLAFTLQHPDKKINWQILFVSKLQGVGKDSIFVPLARLFGQHVKSTGTDEMIHSQFTRYFVDTKLLAIQELHTMTDRNIENKLKPITSSTLQSTLLINDKNEKAYEIPNLLSIIAFSNEDVPIKFRDINERRWFVLRFDGQPLESTFYTEYYKAMTDGGEMDLGYTKVCSPGTTAVVQWLMERDVSSFAFGGNAPHTEFKDQIVRDSDPVVAEIIDLVKDGDWRFGNDILAKSKFEKAIQDSMMGKVTINQKTLSRICDKSNGLIRPVQGPDGGKLAIPKEFQDKFGTKTSRFYVIRNHEYWDRQANRALIEEAAVEIPYGGRGWDGVKVRLVDVAED